MILSFIQNAQTPPANPAPAPAPKAQFFAGVITELDQVHVKVSRSLVGRPMEIRNFIVNPTTKINKSTVKVRSRVTVRYRRMPEGDVALEIAIRPQVATSKS